MSGSAGPLPHNQGMSAFRRKWSGRAKWTPEKRAEKAAALADAAGIVTEKLLQEMEKGDAPWARPWQTICRMPTKISNGQTYSLLNSFRLMYAAEKEGHKSTLYGGVRGWNELGRFIKAGQHGSQVFFMRSSVGQRDQRGREQPSSPEDENAQQERMELTGRRSWRAPGCVTVFNYDQTHGAELPPRFKPYPGADLVPPSKEERHERAQKFIDAVAAKFCPIRTGGNSAHYSPLTDHVQMPEFAQFKSADEYYVCLLHECIHATGHPERLNRFSDKAEGMDKNMREESYSQEELVAVIGSFMAAGMLGIEPAPEDTAKWGTYMRNYASVCREDPRMLPQAIDRAAKAVNFIFDLAPEFQVVRFADEEQGGPGQKGGEQGDSGDMANMSLPPPERRDGGGGGGGGSTGAPSPEPGRPEPDEDLGRTRGPGPDLDPEPAGYRPLRPLPLPKQPERVIEFGR